MFYPIWENPGNKQWITEKDRTCCYIYTYLGRQNSNCKKEVIVLKTIYLKFCLHLTKQQTKICKGFGEKQAQIVLLHEDKAFEKH